MAELNAGEPSKEINIVLADSEVEKTTIMENVIDESTFYETIRIIPPTKKPYQVTRIKNGITFRITYVGLQGSNKERQKNLSRVTLGKADILLYCISAGPLTKFENGNPAIMKSLQDAFGKDIWKSCIIIFTISNQTWDWMNRNKDDPITEYKQFINHYASLVQTQLDRMNVKNTLKVKTVFGFDPTPADHTILAIPAGKEPDDPVLPDNCTTGYSLQWNKVILTEIIRKYDAKLLRSFDPEIAAIIAKSTETKEAYKKAIKNSVPLEIRPVRFNYLGLPRSGKTSFRRRIMGEILNILWAIARGEKEQPSTGVAEAGGQVFISNKTSTDIGTISRKWSTLKDLDEEAGMLGQVIYQTVQEKPSSAATSPTDNSTQRESTRNPSAPEARALAHKNPSISTSAASKWSLVKEYLHNLKVRARPSESAVNDEDNEIEDMFSVIHKAMETKDWDKVKYHLDNIILLINTDTGGQAEFLDLQGSLVQGPSFNLLFSRLVDELESQFEVYYTNEEGESTEKDDSIMTTEEVLFQSLSSIACYSGTFSDGDDTPSGEDSGRNADSKTPRQSKSKVMLVGTHRDMVTQEDFKKKDKLLQDKIKSTPFHEKGIIEFASEDQLMLPVDNMSGDKDEICKIRGILEKVIQRSFDTVTIPASWLVLSLQIRSKNLRTMRLEECEELARKVGISPDVLQHALQFLHHRVGVLLYYPKLKALKGTVICDIQVVFDSATNLIKNVFIFDKVGQSVSEKFREKAQFSLQDVEKATSGYTDTLIPLQKLVQLLEYLGVLTVISSGGSSSQQPTYFMPSVLRSAKPSELRIHSCSDSDPAPLMLRYDCGYVPVGMFPSMITNLVSQHREDWEMIEEGLRKNRVQFIVGEDRDTVTLISHPRYFEVIISRSNDIRMPIRSLCSNVRRVIQSTLGTIALRKTHFKMGYKFGFECPTHPGREHLCVLPHERARKMVCLRDKRESYSLQPHHRRWFTSRLEGPYVSSLPASARPLLEKQLDWNHEGVDRDLIEIAHYMLDWEEKLCHHLGLTKEDVHDIKAIHRDNPVLWRREALRRWKSNQGTRATYENLLELFVKAGHTQCAEAVRNVLTQHSQNH